MFVRKLVESTDIYAHRLNALFAAAKVVTFVAVTAMLMVRPMVWSGTGVGESDSRLWQCHWHWQDAHLTASAYFHRGMAASTALHTVHRHVVRHSGLVTICARLAHSP